MLSRGVARLGSTRTLRFRSIAHCEMISKRNRREIAEKRLLAADDPLQPEDPAQPARPTPNPRQ